jgi:glycerophosphoryl diester phosphodiesterase
MPVTECPIRTTLWVMLIFAHRGAAGRNADENSLEAIKKAVVLGVDGIEVDIRRTRDDEAVLVHDPDLRRIAGDIRMVADLSLDELKQITLRHGTSVVTLDEMTANVPAPVVLDLEVKDQEALDVMIRKLRTSAGLRERTIITSFAQDVIERCAQELPAVRTGLLMRSWPRSWRSFAAWAAQYHLYAVGLSSRQWNAERIARVHAASVMVIAWEIFAMKSLRSRASRLRALGVDVAIVNQPDVYIP